MLKLDFSRQWVLLVVMNYVHIVSFSILVNGYLVGPFAPKRTSSGILRHFISSCFAKKV